MPAHFGLESPAALAEAIHRGQVSMARITEVAAVVVAESKADAVAAGIMARLADEIVAMVRVALERLALTQQEVSALLGGGLVQAADGRLVDAVSSQLAEIAPEAVVEDTLAAHRRRGAACARRARCRTHPPAPVCAASSATG